MATYDLNQVEVNNLLSTGNLDVSVKNFVLNYLFNESTTGGSGANGNFDIGNNNLTDTNAFQGPGDDQGQGNDDNQGNDGLAQHAGQGNDDQGQDDDQGNQGPG